MNAASALAHASVSVSFAGATDMARETADIVLMDDDLSGLITAIHAAKTAMRTVHQNVGIVVVPNVAGMALAAVMPLSPVIAVIINNGAAIVAEMNGFRPLLGPEGWRKLLARRQKGAVLPVEAHLPILLPPADEQPANGHGQNGFHAQTVSVAGMGQNGNGSSNGSYEAIATEADPVKRANGSNGANGHHVTVLDALPQNA